MENALDGFIWDRTQGQIVQRSTKGGTLAERAIRSIYDEIVSGKLAPGEKLKPDSLKERYGVGSSPIREALLRLSAFGLVRLEGRRGFCVAPASEEELRDIADVRCTLSTLAMRRSIQRGDDSWEARVVAAFHRLERMVDQLIADPKTHHGEWELRNKDFHDALESACGSPWLLHFSSVAFSQSERYRRHFVRYPALLPEAQDEHRAIMGAALRRDEASACAHLEHHIMKGMEMVRREMAKRL